MAWALSRLIMSIRLMIRATRRRRRSSRQPTSAHPPSPPKVRLQGAYKAPPGRLKVWSGSNFKVSQTGRNRMAGKTIQIHGRTGNDFDCYLAMPQTGGPVPAVVLASAVHGVDKDLRDLADEFAAHGFIAAAPDLFWRTIPGPLTRADGELT